MAIMTDRKTRQDVFIRVCRDSKFTMDAVKAATFAALVLDCHPLEIWLAMPDFNTMERIADGSHPGNGIVRAGILATVVY